MSTPLQNTYNPSQLVSLDIMNLLGEMDSIFLKYTGTHGMSTFKDEDYVPGMTVGYQVSGMPPVTRGDLMTFTPYEQRTLYIKADTKRWMKSVTSSFNLTDDIFYMRPELVTESLSAPTLRALKEHWELEASQYAIEHSPIIPSYGTPINEPITFPSDGTNHTFDSKVINWLKKLRHDLILPMKSYSLILNTMDYMTLSNSLQGIFNQPITSLVVKSGAPPEQVSDFNNECSPYLGLHKTHLRGGTTPQERGALTFAANGVPTSDENPIASLQNNTDEDIVLRAGDIIYYKARDASDDGLHWIQNTVKRPVPDSRYAFVVTSDLFISQLNDTKMKTFSYSDVEYTIPKSSTPGTPGPAAAISLSHRPIFEGYHQNCSRPIVTEGGSGLPDEFFVLDDHYKNVAINPNFFMMRSFKIPHMKSTEYSYVDDKKTGIKMLVTHDRVFSEGARRGNVFDTTSLSCFGSVAQNLFTLPSGANK